MSFHAASSVRKPAAPARVVLIGTAHTVSLLTDQLSLLPEPPMEVGMVVVDADEAQGTHIVPLSELAPLCAEVRPDIAVVSLPRTKAATRLRVSSALRALGIAERFVQPLDELVDEGAAPALGPSGRLSFEDLIGRTPYGIDRRAVSGLIEGRRVLITGAGGSIGSEIARICATFSPERLILMERSENALFEIDRQLAQRAGGVPRKALMHDVVDSESTLRQLVELRPHVVFHAAAHKHVPLMEDHPAHAITNNLFGTKSIADASLACGVERFVLISSDKAVNPTSVMGATKRLAEMYVQALHRRGGGASGGAGGATTRFSMVRFGNVLGSACSVIPIWQQQLMDGGPLTVTDARMTRYFMTIHEAASLVIQAAAIDDNATGSASVYVLDMGEPVRILDLARRFVSAHGLVPRVLGMDDPETPGPTIEIAITGSRPGEKLHEELAYAAEQLRPTNHPGVNAWCGELREDFNLPAMIADLSAARLNQERESVLAAIRRHVPEMQRASALADVKPGARVGRAA